MLVLLAFALVAQAQSAPQLATTPPGAPSANSRADALPAAPAAALDPTLTERPAPLEPVPRVHTPGDFPTAERALLDAQMREYFAGEKREAYAWLGAGVLAAGAGAWLTSSSSDIAHGASYPLLDISVVQFAAALYLFWRTGDQVAQLSELLESHPCAFFANEPARMRRVNRGFSIYPPAEAATLVGGAAMAGFGATGKHDFLQGAGWGLVAQSVVLLVFDQFAAARAETYQRELDAAERRHASQCALQK